MIWECTCVRLKLEIHMFFSLNDTVWLDIYYINNTVLQKIKNNNLWSRLIFAGSFFSGLFYYKFKKKKILSLVWFHKLLRDIFMHFANWWNKLFDHLIELFGVSSQTNIDLRCTWSCASGRWGYELHSIIQNSKSCHASIKYTPTQSIYGHRK